MPGQRARQQHTVARAYLSGFADQRRMVYMLRRSGVRTRVAITNATVRRDFYTYIDDTGEANESIERWMAESIEGPAADPLKSACASVQPQPSAEDVRDLARFVAVSLMRTATVRSYLQQMDTHFNPTLLLAALAKENDYRLVDLSQSDRQQLLAAISDALSASKKDTAWEQRSRLRTMLRKADELMTVLATWHWRLDEATTDCLITADVPVATLTSQSTTGWRGILPSGSSLFLPVSPRRLLVASPVPLFTSGAVSAQLASRVNTELCRNARDAVYINPAMPWPSGLTLAAQGPTLPSPTISWRASKPDSTPTFPVTYPSVADPEIATLLGDLGAMETVE